MGNGRPNEPCNGNDCVHEDHGPISRGRQIWDRGKSSDAKSGRGSTARNALPHALSSSLALGFAYSWGRFLFFGVLAGILPRRIVSSDYPVSCSWTARPLNS